MWLCYSLLAISLLANRNLFKRQLQGYFRYRIRDTTSRATLSTEPLSWFQFNKRDDFTIFGQLVKYFHVKKVFCILDLCVSDIAKKLLNIHNLKGIVHQI